MSSPPTASYSGSGLPEVGDVLGERYQLTGYLGEGGMGVIMTARQLSMDREVAVKLVHPEALKSEAARLRFEREVHLAKELAHPHIVQLIDFGRQNEVAWVVMELLEGETLADLIARESPMPLGRALDILEQILDALTLAHRKKVVHRDLKPPNIFLLPGNRQKDFVKVLDFGIARPIEDSGLYKTTTGFVSGTLPYMAPEVLAHNEISPSGDVYAAGLVFLEMLYGQRIYDGDNPTRMALQHMRKETPIPQMLMQTPLGPVMIEATAKRPVNRYPDAESFLAAVIEARKGVDESEVLSNDEIAAAFESVARDVVDDLMPTSNVRVSAVSTTADESEIESDSTVVAPPSRAPVIAAIVVFTLLTMGGLLAFVGTGPEVDEREGAPDTAPVTAAVAPPKPEPEAKPEPTPEPAGADVFIDSKPTGAEVWIDGQQRYTTPVEVRIAEPAEWELRKEGFEPEKLLVGPDTRRLIAHLDAIETVVEPKPASPVVAKRKVAARPKPKKNLKPTTKPEPKEVKRAPKLVD